MKYRIRKTKEIVDVVSYSTCSYTRFPDVDYVCYIDSNEKEIIGKGLNLIWDFEPIDEESTFDWQSFRAEVARDILCAMLVDQRISEITTYKDLVKMSLECTDELIKQLKEKEEK